jgi:hypothetical protein
MFLLVQSAKAADTDVNITVEKKRLEHTAGSGFQPNSDTSKKTDEWAFTVTVENQTFKALENLEVKYIIFYKTEKLGQKGPARKETKSGSYTIPSIASLDKAIFDTDSVKLTRGMLIGQPGSYEYFTNGAKPNAADTLTGIWIRIYKDGNQFAEYGYPAGLTSTEQWQDSN